MKYMGGKRAARKYIVPLIESRLQGRPFVEPFCGALHISACVPGAGHLLNDACEGLVGLYTAIADGTFDLEEIYETLPREGNTISREFYGELKARYKEGDRSPLVMFVGFAGSFGGRIYQAHDPYNKPNGGSLLGVFKKLKRRMMSLTRPVFRELDYRDLDIPTGSLIYCDPPYSGTSGYPHVGKFDHDAFWEWVRTKTREGHTVLVSEKTAPEDMTAVLTFDIPAPMTSKSNACRRVEHVFEYRA